MWVKNPVKFKDSILFLIGNSNTNIKVEISYIIYNWHILIVNQKSLKTKKKFGNIVWITTLVES